MQSINRKPSIEKLHRFREHRFQQIVCLVIHVDENVTSVNHRKQQLYAYATIE